MLQGRLRRQSQIAGRASWFLSQRNRLCWKERSATIRVRPMLTIIPESDAVIAFEIDGRIDKDDVERVIAVVTDKSWVRSLVGLQDLALPMVDIKAFALADDDIARLWVKNGNPAATF